MKTFLEFAEWLRREHPELPVEEFDSRDVEDALSEGMAPEKIVEVFRNDFDEGYY